MPRRIYSECCDQTHSATVALTTVVLSVAHRAHPSAGSMRPFKSRIHTRASLQDLPFETVKDFSSLFASKIRWGNREDDSRLVNETYIRVLRRLRCAQKPVSSHRKRGSGQILDLPLEIVYEILSLLYPVDLWHLSYVNKNLHALLSSPTSKWLWNLVFERNSPIPPCPPDMMPLKWAQLLFGPASCQRCGVQKVVLLNMHWRRRLCMDCAHYWAGVVRDRFLAEAARAEEGTGRAQTEEGCRGSFYHPGTVASDMYMCATCQKYVTWMQHIRSEDERETEAQLDAIIKMMAKYLRKDGHQEVHVQHFVRSHPTRPVANMFLRGLPKDRLPRLQERGLKATKRHIRDNWSTKFKVLSEGLLYEAANLRTPLLTERSNVVRHMWTEYVTSLDAMSRCAEVPDIVRSEPFATMVNDPSDRAIEEEQVIKALALFAERWLPYTMEDLFARRPELLLSASGFLDPPPTHSINSAASVFTCRGCEASPSPDSANGYKLIGWNIAVAHLLEDSLHLLDLAEGPPLRVNEPGCVAARSLLELLGLHPQTTLADDMDKSDACFICLECEGANGVSVPLSWRECVAHFIELRGPQSHLVPSWSVVLHEVSALSVAG
ncbi:hypothetical protein LshimejAT787_1402220 [Lyophyllum shimeji]|uniref:F-box domain-containing protein n=1 Tax=Lyophyllum shimeji TaxID=47721 RepID=A0A9P3PVI1_LYOSH|nr:hypothetical protein LshimejAT787_1402220 [Lyophyllum shimeji]